MLPAQTTVRISFDANFTKVRTSGVKVEQTIRERTTDRVHRDCPEHGGECHCVGRHEENGLVFWCDREGHHFSTR